MCPHFTNFDIQKFCFFEQTTWYNIEKKFFQFFTLQRRASAFKSLMMRNCGFLSDKALDILMAFKVVWHASHFNKGCRIWGHVLTIHFLISLIQMSSCSSRLNVFTPACNAKISHGFIPGRTLPVAQIFVFFLFLWPKCLLLVLNRAPSQGSAYNEENNHGSIPGLDKSLSVQ